MIQIEVWKETFDASVNGAGISLADISSPGTLIHTASVEVDVHDEVWLYAVNPTGADAIVNVLWGGVAGKDLIRYTVANSDGVKAIIPGWVLKNGATIKAYASVSGALTLQGFVNRFRKSVAV